MPNGHDPVLIGILVLQNGSGTIIGYEVIGQGNVKGHFQRPLAE